MVNINASWIWRIAAALFIGAILTFAVTALPETTGDPVPADVGQSSDDDPPPVEAPEDDGSSEVDDDMARSVGEPSDTEGEPDDDADDGVDVEVLSEADEADPLDPDGAEIGSVEPATQVEGDPQFTG